MRSRHLFAVSAAMLCAPLGMAAISYLQSGLHWHGVAWTGPGADDGYSLIRVETGDFADHLVASSVFQYPGPQGPATAYSETTARYRALSSELSGSVRVFIRNAPLGGDAFSDAMSTLEVRFAVDVPTAFRVYANGFGSDVYLAGITPGPPGDVAIHVSGFESASGMLPVGEYSLRGQAFLGTNGFEDGVSTGCGFVIPAPSAWGALFMLAWPARRSRS